MVEEAKQRTPQEDQFIHACQRGSIDDIRKLLSNGVDINLRDRNGSTPIFNCRNDDQLECARFLINHGAELNFTNIRGNTALHVATERGSKGIVLLYLLSGASPNIKNHEGFKPEDLNTNLLPLIHAVSRDRDHWGVLNDSYKARLKQIFDEIEGGDEAKVLTLDKCIKFNRFIDEESNDEVIRNDASEFIRDVAICRPGEVGLEEWLLSFCKLASEQGVGAVDSFIEDFETKIKTRGKYTDFKLKEQ